MKVYVGIIESTDYDRRGYAFDETVGVFSSEDMADSITNYKYTELKKGDNYDSPFVTGYRVDEYTLDGSSYKRGATKWIDDNGTIEITGKFKIGDRVVVTEKMSWCKGYHGIVNGMFSIRKRLPVYLVRLDESPYPMIKTGRVYESWLEKEE